MDKKTRGFIEKTIDDITKIDFVEEGLSWILEDVPIYSVKDLALGWAVGAIHTFALTEIGRTIRDEEENEIRNMIRRRLPEILDKINRELNR